MGQPLHQLLPQQPRLIEDGLSQAGQAEDAGPLISSDDVANGFFGFHLAIGAKSTASTSVT
ncbi:hypothetical protein [Micromonospora sp. NPDC002575]|uniref:hypothetical protein n=1 Tax=Micromonospora sp. NPDC002575 TaxID=3364222 RepID=UPI00368461FA